MVATRIKNVWVVIEEYCSIHIVYLNSKEIFISYTYITSISLMSVANKLSNSNEICYDYVSRGGSVYGVFDVFSIRASKRRNTREIYFY
jgi:hypothetical protein